jgi:hypothetical protein
MEVLSWIQQLCQQLNPSEYIMVQACTFAYHCTQLSSQIQRLLSGDTDLVLDTYSSIFQLLDEAEKIWTSSYNAVESSTSSLGVHAYQGNFQMNLSARILTFLLRAREVDCSHQEQIDFTTIQERCIAAFRATATRILHMQGMPEDTCHLPNSNINFGWADAVMVYGSLRTIEASPISLGWQKNAANRIRVIMKERLGFQLLS